MTGRCGKRMVTVLHQPVHVCHKRIFFRYAKRFTISIYDIRRKKQIQNSDTRTDFKETVVHKYVVLIKVEILSLSSELYF